jgi:hypothetical protein
MYMTALNSWVKERFKDGGACETAFEWWWLLLLISLLDTTPVLE